MAGKQKKGGGGNRKHGRDEAKCKAYRNAKTREKNKIKRVLQSCGMKAAIEYAKKNGVNVPSNKAK